MRTVVLIFVVVLIIALFVFSVYETKKVADKAALPLGQDSHNFGDLKSAPPVINKVPFYRY